MDRRAILTFAALAMAPLSAVAASEPPVICNLQAYLPGDDMIGTDVRSGAGSRAPLILHVPGAQPAIAAVTGFQDGWFRIERLEQVGTDDDRTLLDRREGWIHRSRLHVDVAPADPNLWVEPGPGSRLVRRLAGEQQGVVLLGCAGDWAKVGVGGEIGWLSPAGQCANPLTTCP